MESNQLWSPLGLVILWMFYFNIQCSAATILLPIFPVFLKIRNLARLLLEGGLYWYSYLVYLKIMLQLSCYLSRLHMLFSWSLSNILLSQIVFLIQNRLGLVSSNVEFLVLGQKLCLLHFLWLKHIEVINPLELVLLKWLALKGIFLFL